MAIYIRDKQGDLTALNIPAINGKSAYEVALSNGFKGTEQEWLDSLKGENGSEEVYIGTAEEAPPTASMVIDPEEDNEYDGFFTDSKYDYLGKEHSTLKAVNDSNIEHVLRRVNTQKYEGSSITANNTYMKQVNNVILKGVTKFKDVDTGDFLDNYEEGKNLKLVGGKNNKLVIESAKLVLNNKEIVDIYNNMNYNNVKAILTDDGYFVLNNNGAWLFPNKVWHLKPNTTYTIQASGDGVVDVTHYSNSGLKNEKWYNKYNEKYIQLVATTDDTGIFGLLLRFDINKKVDFKVFEGDSRGNLIKRKSYEIQLDTCELHSIENTYDYIDLNTGLYVQNIKMRTYQLGDESNNKVLTDKKNTLYKLEQPIVSKIELKGQKIYSYDGVTHYTCQSESSYPSPILSMEVPTDLASLVQEERAINKKLYNDQNTIIDSQLSLYESMSDMLLKDNNDIVPEYIQDLYELAYERGIRIRKQEVDINENTR